MVKADSARQPFLASEFALIGQVLQFVRFLEKTLDEPQEKRRSKSLEDSDLQWSYAVESLNIEQALVPPDGHFIPSNRLRVPIPSN